MDFKNSYHGWFLSFLVNEISLFIASEVVSRKRYVNWGFDLLVIIVIFLNFVKTDRISPFILTRPS